MWGSAATEPPGGGFGRGVPPPAENFAILGTENHVLMHFRTTFWGYNVDYLLCLVTLQLKMMIFLIFFFFFFFFKNVKIRGNPRIRGEISCLVLGCIDKCMFKIKLLVDVVPLHFHTRNVRNTNM